MLDGSYFFECQCTSAEHTVRFILNKQDKEIYVSMFLDHFQPWYKRVLIALKYIFKMPQGFNHYHFAECVLVEDDIDALEKMLKDFRKP